MEKCIKLTTDYKHHTIPTGQARTLFIQRLALRFMSSIIFKIYVYHGKQFLTNSWNSSGY